jgi:hypothetical protein
MKFIKQNTHNYSETISTSADSASGIVKMSPAEAGCSSGTKLIVPTLGTTVDSLIADGN